MLNSQSVTPGQPRTPERGPGQALGDVEEQADEAADAPAEDAGVGMDRPQPAVGQVGGNIQLRPGQLQGDQDPDQNRHRPPDDAPGDETLDHIVRVAFLVIHNDLL